MKIPSLAINCKIKGQMLFSASMQQSVHVLQLPMIELSGWIENYIDQNPLIERMESSSCRGKNSFAYPFYEDNFAASPSLFEHLMQQVELSFAKEDCPIAEIIIGSLDEKGFLPISMEELSCQCKILEGRLEEVLKKVQGLDPVGVGARSLQECLLLQLKGQEQAIAYQVISQHFEALLHHQHPLICKKLGCSEKSFQDALQIISSLTPYPGKEFSKKFTPTIYPDVSLKKEDDVWTIHIHEEVFPAFQIMQPPKVSSSEEKQMIKEHLNSAKWLTKVLSKRKQALLSLSQYLLKKHLFFFEEKTALLEPISMSEAAQDLGWHISTLSRAVSEKYLSTPGGIFPLKKFFNASVQKTEEKGISSQTIKEVMRKIISGENTRAPYSDRELVEKLRQAGISSSRRTIVKYRQALGYLAAYQRKTE